MSEPRCGGVFCVLVRLCWRCERVKIVFLRVIGGRSAPQVQALLTLPLTLVRGGSEMCPVDPFALFADDHIPPCVAPGAPCAGRCETLALVHQVGRRLYLRIEAGLGVAEAAQQLAISQPELVGIMTGSLAYTSSDALHKAARLFGVDIDDSARVERCFTYAHTPRNTAA